MVVVLIVFCVFDVSALRSLAAYVNIGVTQVLLIPTFTFGPHKWYFVDSQKWCFVAAFIACVLTSSL